MTTSTAFVSSSNASAGTDRLTHAGQAFGKILFTMTAAARRWARNLDERRQFETLDQRALDDIGLTQAERDELLKR
jgi:uncharacterized protein YjiS (DUF1127 family)